MRKVFKSFVLAFVLVLAFVRVGFGEERQGGQPQKKYPPYPDVWEWEMHYKYKDYSLFYLKTEDLETGERDVIAVAIDRKKFIQNKPNKVLECQALFSGQKYPVETCTELYNCSEKNKVCKIKGKNISVSWLGRILGVSKSYITEDEDKRIFVKNEYFIMGSKCSISWPIWKVEEKKTGRILAEKAFVVLLDKPLKVDRTGCMEDPPSESKYRIERVRDADVYKIDGGFIAEFSVDLSKINLIRFDNNLQTKSKLLNKKVFLVDLEEIKKEIDRRGAYGDDQKIIDAIYYTVKQKKGGKP